MTTDSTYRKIVDNSFGRDDEYWHEATKVVTFAGAIAGAASADNLKKLGDALKAINSQ